MKSNAWSVGQVAERFGMPTNVLRHWEAVGLLTPERDSADRRRYHRPDLVRVAVIQRSKAAGMSLDQIRTLLDAEAFGRHQVLEAHIADLDRRMEEMRLSREMAMHAFECKAHDVSACPNFRAHVDDLLAAFE
ncbi:MerR family transcriptional regulator [Nocardioides marmoriginsengisoli]|uniref:MerR family transcriptional regulator n=1 Tax=Nocardioides marmoriginsengisoli TaxID=661483 RepID=A0A3N0CLE5_9ACTN|nr:MerR family transcriptional regulator [Nocardioides marmoriginsengisoli]RNL63733.1 MerR family transcriptional regulator [Nocardioides marmoriginsengisoli]